MPRIQAPDLAQRIVRRYGIVGQSGPDTLGPEILPVAIVDVLPTEEAYGPRFAMGNCYQTATAGELSQAHLHNPPNSGVLVRPAGVWICAPTAGATGYFIIGYNSGTINELPTAETARYLDRRTGVNPTARLTRGTAVSTGILTTEELFRGYTRFDESIYVPLPSAALREDDGLHIAFSVVNQIAVFDFVWEEEPLRPTD